AAAEVPAGKQDPSARECRAVQLEARLPTPVVEKELCPAGSLDPLQELLREDLVGVDVGAVEDGGLALHAPDGFHAGTAWRARTSTKWPASAAAAAIAGLTRCVLPPRPCRPSKFRFEVEAQRSRGARMSGFIPRHIEQPARRHSKPARWKIRSSTSSSAFRRPPSDPGTTIERT